MNWNHKGVEIELRGEKFRAAMDGVPLSAPSLAALKKNIDKRMDAKAKEVTVSLPVVFWRSTSWRSTGKDGDGIGHATITGIKIEGERGEIVGGEGWDGYNRSNVMPDTPENEKLILDLRAAKELVNQLEEKISQREVGIYLGSKPEYATAIKNLQDRYRDAVKASKESQ